MPYVLLKRGLDVVAASALLLLLLPLFLIITAGVALDLGQPIFFRQPRAGLRGCEFQIIKFRTMHDSRGPDGQYLPNEQRITALGRFLRRTSMDELPELWNVLLGDMSLIGPRPLLTDYIPLYSPEQHGDMRCALGSLASLR